VSLGKVDVEWEADDVTVMKTLKCVELRYDVGEREIMDVIGMVRRDIERFSRWLLDTYGKVETAMRYLKYELQIEDRRKCPLTREDCLREECMMYDWKTESCRLMDIEVYCE